MTSPEPSSTSGALRVGLALGSGSARGWAHIGVIQALQAAGIEPDVVCGASVGALVGGAYVSGELEAFEAWVRDLSGWDVVRLLDVRFLGGGLIEGERLMAFIRQYVAERPIEALPRRFAAVTTDLETGREIWLQRGSLLEAVRASLALPGLFPPARLGERWVVDGGLVNPVPISLCRALGAEVVIAVNLNGDIVGKHHAPSGVEGRQRRRKAKSDQHTPLEQLMARFNAGPKKGPPATRATTDDESAEAPGLVSVLMGSINIMQDRITRSRMAGDPPDVHLVPRMGHLGMLDFHRAEECIEEGRGCVERSLPALKALFGV